MKKTETGSMSLVPGVAQGGPGQRFDRLNINSFGLVGFWFGVDVGVYLVYSL